MEAELRSLRAEGCAWGMLYTGSNGFYERLGWRTVRTPYRQGLMAADPPGPGAAYDVAEYDPRTLGWGGLAAVYEAYNAARPLTVARDDGYWPAYASVAFLAPGGIILAARRPGDARVCAYLRGVLTDDVFGALEIGALPGDEEALGALLYALAWRARARGVGRGRAYLPREQAVDEALARVFGDIEVGGHEAVMVLPLQPGVTQESVEALYRLPGAIYWPADDF